MASTTSAKDSDSGSDRILCSYEEDSTNHDASTNGTHNDPSKDSEDSLRQDVIAIDERFMKTSADDFIRSLDLRLSKLELRLEEVHTSVQLLRDKQELAETRKEIAKLLLVKKEAHSSINPQSNDGRSSPSAIDPSSPQLASALPHQVAPRQQLAAPLSQDPVQNMTQATRQPRYYTVPTPLPNPPAVSQLLHNQYLPSDPHYQNPPQTSSQVTQAPLVPQFSQYQQQWPQQLPQKVQHPQLPSMQSQTRPPSTNVYSAYPASQSTNPLPTETLSNSMPMQMPYSGKPAHYAQYPPTSASLQNSPQHNLMVWNPIQSQFIGNRPYNELIENLMNIIRGGGHLPDVIQWMEEIGQPIDFRWVPRGDGQGEVLLLQIPIEQRPAANAG